MATVDVRQDSFPSRSREVSGLVNGIATEITSTSFADKILITISQEGRLSQWIQVPLTGSSSGVVEMNLPSSNKGLLPSTHLTPTTLFGGGGEERETLGQLYAAQIASQICLRSPDDRRILVLGLGLGLSKTDLEREAFFDLLELAQKVL
ncbi:hypothetical protein NW756_007324 [Fusarium oxysporum]|nr:hypothetical protein NW753_001450 [Fusarium oxysporum]KAJ4071886.1 hypothetical protein NW763_000909 [Fusarium oxysporum]KAJ4088924.1 hypothetical protein NW756_007324 [Fusarium oxysporum]KAJ4116594.1 hypothetical protein NW769_003664 [Fusarium oxysporum]KAJ4225245.1 hypothetical protein NW760_009709 [Fusarium oxysporum]